MIPDYTEQQWNIRACDNRVRVVLTQRHDINYYYTSVERLNEETNRWEHVKGSSVPHTESKQKAMERVEKLLKTYTIFS
jgi:ribulose bisphosphate carboxylase small subunit